MRFIGQMWTNTFENFNGLNEGLQGATPPGGDDADWSQPRKYPAITYHDLRFEWNVARGNAGVGRDLRFYVGIDNVFDQNPPLGADVGATGAGANRSIYEYRGRNFYAGFRARF
jgi:outer membrane receptor protein involved in Fe transport